MAKSPQTLDAIHQRIESMTDDDVAVFQKMMSDEVEDRVEGGLDGPSAPSAMI